MNIDDLDNIPEGVLWEDIKFDDFYLSKSDYDNLLKLFCQFDKPFDVLIDEYEEEIIPASRIQTAIEMTESFANKASPTVKNRLKNFL